MQKRHFIFRSYAIICFGVIFILGTINVNGQAPDTSNVLKIRKSYVEADFFPRIHDVFDGNITKSELMDPRGIYTIAPMDIISFELHSFDREKEIIMKSTSQFLTPIMKNHIKNLYPESILYFRNIRGRDKEGRSLILNPIRLVIVKE